jgi:hypothetical protein
MIGILGSGFGLYGYLPAIAQSCTDMILLPCRYKEKFDSRVELNPFIDRIIWVDSEEILLKQVDTIIFALIPTKQMYWLEKIIYYPNIYRVILEKPIATSPELSEIMLVNLINSKKIFRISYSLIYTDWATKLLTLLSSKPNIDTININWSFFAHHYKNNLDNWKRHSIHGGGIIRFYGIHIIALLVFIGFPIVDTSIIYETEKKDSFRWVASFTNDKQQLCQICIDTMAHDKFDIEVLTLNTIEQKMVLGNPFNDTPSGTLDSRVYVLRRLLDSMYDTNDINSLYKNVNHLWKKVEEKTQIMIK